MCESYFSFAVPRVTFAVSHFFSVRGIRRETVAFDWKNTGDYGSVADVIATDIPQLHPLSLGAASSALSTERSTEKDTGL